MSAPLDNSSAASSRTRVVSSFPSRAKLRLGLPLLRRRPPEHLLARLAALRRLGPLPEPRLEPLPGPLLALPQAEREQALARKGPIRAERERTLRMSPWAIPRPSSEATSSAWEVRSIKPP